jgi:hypothetical protein
MGWDGMKLDGVLRCVLRFALRFALRWFSCAMACKGYHVGQGQGQGLGRLPLTCPTLFRCCLPLNLSSLSVLLSLMPDSII